MEPSTEAQLSVRRGREAVDFYRAAFAATVLHEVGGTASNESVVAQMAVGSSRFWVSDESPEHRNFSPETLGGATARMLLLVDDPAAVIGRAVAAGAELIAPVSEQHGWLFGRITDPFGHDWEIGKPLGEWPPAN